MASTTDDGTTNKEFATATYVATAANAAGQRIPDPIVGADLGAGSFLEAVAESLDSFLSTFDAACFAGPDAATLVARFARIERLASAGKTFAARRSAEAEVHRASGHQDPARWLAAQTGETLGQAADTLALGRALCSQPGVEDAFRKGALSDPKVRLISNAVSVNPDSEAELLDTAGTATVRQVQDRCARAKAQARSAQDEAARVEALRRRRMCRTWTDREDGAFCLSARLTPEDGARVRSVLEGATDRVFEQARRAGLHETHDNYAADALVALLTDTSNDPIDPIDPVDSGDAVVGDRPFRLRRAPGPSRSKVHVRIDLDALRQGRVGPGQVCEIPGVGPISVETAMEIMGDAITTLFITDGVDVASICQIGRHIPAPIAAALLERDPTCVVPGCDRSDHLQVDHWQVDFAGGGATEWWNLARLCGHHHRLKTAGRFRLVGGPGNWRFLPVGAGPPT